MQKVDHKITLRLMPAIMVNLIQYCCKYKIDLHECHLNWRLFGNWKEECTNISHTIRWQLDTWANLNSFNFFLLVRFLCSLLVHYESVLFRGIWLWTNIQYIELCDIIARIATWFRSVGKYWINAAANFGACCTANS